MMAIALNAGSKQQVGVKMMLCAFMLLMVGTAVSGKEETEDFAPSEALQVIKDVWKKFDTASKKRDLREKLLTQFLFDEVDEMASRGKTVISIYKALQKKKESKTPGLHKK